MIERYSRPEMRKIWSEDNRFSKFLEVELAALREQAKTRGIPKTDVGAFARAARGFSLEDVRAREKTLSHEFEAFLEEVLSRTGKFPEVSRFFHFGLTSNDVLDTAMALQMVEAAVVLEEDWERVLAATEALARKHAGTWMAGRTHGIHAEPITFGLKVAGWHAEGIRNGERIRRAARTAAFGKLSGAVGGYSALGPESETRALKSLGLKPEPAATQVIPRDRHAEYLAALALSAAAVERIATEIRHLQRTEVREVQEPFHPGQKGSSAMPHKKNPVLCENLCGLARLVRAYLPAALENVVLWHERDLSHSSVERVAFPDSCLLLDFMLHRLAGILEGLRVFPDRMRRNLDETGGDVFSQRALLALVEAGMDRVEAYAVVQRCAFAAREKGESLRETLAQVPEVRKRLNMGQLKDCFGIESYGRHVPAVLKRVGIR